MDERAVREQVEREIREKALRYIGSSIEWAHGRGSKIVYPLTKPQTGEVVTGSPLTGKQAHLHYITAISAEINFALAMGWIKDEEWMDWISRLPSEPPAHDM